MGGEKKKVLESVKYSLKLMPLGPNNCNSLR